MFNNCIIKLLPATLMLVTFFSHRDYLRDSEVHPERAKVLQSSRDNKPANLRAALKIAKLKTIKRII